MPSHICGDVIMNQWLNVFYLFVQNLLDQYKILMLVLSNGQILGYNVQTFNKYCANIVQTNWGSVSVGVSLVYLGLAAKLEYQPLASRSG